MKAITEDLHNEVDELLILLDLDVQHITKSLSQLNELRSLLIKRDDAALGRLLEHMQAESNSYKDHELRRQSLRKKLAQDLGCTAEQTTLSALEAVLPNEKRTQVNEKRTQLKSLIGELKKEYLRTMLLLSEFARLNNRILNGILRLGDRDALTYSSNGLTSRQTDTTFVSFHL
jgi:flagellar biosynthesis/type III secretory pathway chaperone